MFFRKGVLKHFQNFTGKHREIYEFLKTSFFTDGTPQLAAFGI